MAFRRRFFTRLIAAALLCGSPLTYAQTAADPLAKRISLPATSAPLEEVLRSLAKRGGVPLSYSSTLLPRVPVKVPAQNGRPLREVLQTVLRDQPVSYGFIDGQLVLWRKGERPPTPARGAAPTPAPAAQTAAAGSAAKPGSRSASAVTASAAPAGGPRTAPAAPAPQAGARTAATGKASGAGSAGKAAKGVKTSSVPKTTAAKTAPAPAVPPADATASTAPTPVTSPAPQAATPAGTPGTTGSKRAIKVDPKFAAAAQKVGAAIERTAEKVGEAVRSALKPDTSRRVAGPAPLPAPAALPAPDSVAAPKPLPAPAAVAPPVAPAAPNHPAWERKPFQFSFVPPLSTNGWRNAQTVNNISLNLLVGYAAGVEGMELGSLVNVTRDTMRGFQAAGLINATGHHMEGIQMAGLLNAVAGSANGWQAAGLVNLATKPGNLTQTAGLLNVATGEIHGVQAAGLLNVAGRVKGVQLAGLINIADTVEGASIAVLNLVAKGYHRVEVTTNETFPFNASIKLGGSPAFYTYFTGAVQPFTSTTRWGAGFGLGAELAARRRVSVTLDLQSLRVKEDDISWSAWGRQLNQQNQFRMLLGWAPTSSRRFRIVAGPTINVLVTDRIDPKTGNVDSALGVGQVGEVTDLNASGNTRVRGWLGFTGGVRF